MMRRREATGRGSVQPPAVAGGRRRLFLMWVLALAALSTCRCSTLQVSIDRDETIPIPRGSTWAWEPEPPPRREDELDPRVNNSIIHGRVQRAVAATLAEKGFRQTEPQQADFLVAYRVAVRDRQQTVTQAIPQPAAPVFAGPGWTWGYYGPPIVTTRQIQYTEGALMIDIVQRATGKLAYRAVGTDSITRDDASEEAVRKVVAKLLGELP